MTQKSHTSRQQFLIARRRAPHIYMASTTATYLGLLLLTANSVPVMSRSQGDAAAMFFVAASYLSLILLFHCPRRFEMAHPNSVERRRARIDVWLTTTLLTAMFTWRVAAVMPQPVAAGVLFMGASTVAGGSYALFLLPRAAAEH